MNTSRLLLVCPQFWPISEQRSLLATAFAGVAADSGHNVTVVTRHLIGYWPSTFRMGRVNVVRLSQRNTRLMDSVRVLGGRDPWIRELGRWLSANRNQFDFAIVIAGDGEIPIITNVLKRWELASVIRFENTMSQGSHQNFDNCEAGLVWATPYDSPGIRSPIAIIGDGAEIRDVRGDTRESHRRALEKAHPMLDIPDPGPLVFCSSPLERRHGVFELATAWKRLLRTCPTARIWFVGSGVDGYHLFQHIRDLEVEHAVIMPGGFDHANDLIMVADAIVIPGQHSNTGNEAGFFVKTACANRLPLICHSGHIAIELYNKKAGQSGIGSGASVGKVWTFYEPDNPLASVLDQWNQWRASIVGNLPTILESSTNSIQEMALRYIELGQTMLKTNGEPRPKKRLARQEAKSRNETDSYDSR